MLLDLLRHGEALPLAESDRERPLSPAGAAAVDALRVRLLADGWRPGRAFTSPLRRARETAERVLAGLPVPAEVMEALTPDTDPEESLEALAEALAGPAPGEHVLVVSHQPLLGRLVHRLTGTAHPLTPGTLLRIECDAPLHPGTARVQLVLHPESG